MGQRRVKGGAALVGGRIAYRLRVAEVSVSCHGQSEVLWADWSGPLGLGLGIRLGLT